MYFILSSLSASCPYKQGYYKYISMKNQCKLDVSAIQIILKTIAQNPLRDSLKYFYF